MRSGRGINYPSPFGADVKERVELYLPHLGLHGLFTVKFTFTFTLTVSIIPTVLYPKQR
jgi:hypothetical protein